MCLICLHINKENYNHQFLSLIIFAIVKLRFYVSRNKHMEHNLIHMCILFEVFNILKNYHASFV